MHLMYKIDKADKIVLKKGEWVRVKNGLYGGDLAKIIHVPDSKNGALCKIVPRIPNDEDVQRKKDGLSNSKPHKKHFSTNYVTSGEIKEIIHDTTGKRVYKWQGMHFRRGFLFKFFTMNNLELNNAKPIFSEITSFKCPEPENELSDDSSSDSDVDFMVDDKAQVHTTAMTAFKIRDTIKVIRGELNGLTGKIVDIKARYVIFKPDIEDYDKTLMLDFKMITKYFKPGDLVHIVSGFYTGEVGTVIKTTDEKVQVFSKIHNKEFTVNSSNLKHYSKVTEAIDSLNNRNQNPYGRNYEEFRIGTICKDLSGKITYIVLSIDIDSVKVMDQMGE